MKFLDLETSKYLASLGCVSESGKKYQVCECAAEVHGGPILVSGDSTEDICHYGGSVEERTPAFSLEDLLRKKNAEKIAKSLFGNTNLTCWSDAVVDAFQSHPDTWPEEAKKLILK